MPEKAFFQPFFQLKEDLAIVRMEYLYHIKSRENNLIKITNKGQFEDELDELKRKVEKVRNDLINNLQKEIINTRKQIFLTLVDFLKANPTNELLGLEGEVMEGEVASIANKIISQIRFPSARNLLGEMKLEYHYYDLTWEDLNNKEVLKEMIDLQLIRAEDKIYFDELAIKASPRV